MTNVQFFKNMTKFILDLIKLRYIGEIHMLDTPWVLIYQSIKSILYTSWTTSIHRVKTH